MRTAWLVALGPILLGLGLWARARGPSSLAALDCPPEQVRWVDAGTGLVAACEGQAHEPPLGAQRAVGLKLNLNRASAEELALLPGVGPSLARRIVEAREARGGRFSQWSELDAIPGIGEAKLLTLRQDAELR